MMTEVSVVSLLPSSPFSLDDMVDDLRLQSAQSTEVRQG